MMAREPESYHGRGWGEKIENKMSRRPTVEGMLVREFAQAMGCTIQWAGQLRKRKDKQWLDFLARRTPEGEKVATVATPGMVESAQDDLSRARASKQMAWDHYARADELARRAFGRPDAADCLPALQRAAAEARKSYEAAATYEHKLAVQAGEYVPIGAVQGMRAALPQIVECIQSLRTNVAGRLPEHMRTAFYQAFDLESPSWNEGIRKVDAYLETLMPTGDA